MSQLPDCHAATPPDAPWWWRRANWLHAAIAAGELPDHDDPAEPDRYPVTVETLGQLSFEGGQLVVADPYVMAGEAAPITQALRTTPYDVLVATAEVGPDHPRIAAALLVSGDEAVVTWEMAHWPGQDVAGLGPQEFFGYGVDAGTGCFASPRAAKIAGRVLMADAGMLEDPVSLALFDGDAAAGSAVVAPEAGAAPIAVFSSGWGDGYYPTWLGRDEKGEVVVAITDFLVANDPHAQDDADAS